MANATRKERHSYRVSYAQEVGSSIDPDLEDVASWEQELAGMYLITFSLMRKVSHIYVINPSKLILFFFFGHAVSDPAIPHDTTTTTRSPQGEELTPIDLDDEELAAYAEECAAMADFDDIPEEELFSWSDLEEPDEHEYDMDIA